MNKALIQWKAAMVQMQHANQIAAEFDPLTCRWLLW
jgi:hypothetical protein